MRNWYAICDVLVPIFHALRGIGTNAPQCKICEELNLQFIEAEKACYGDWDAKIVCTFKLHVFSVLYNAAVNMTMMGQQGSAAMSGGKLSFVLYRPVHGISNNVVCATSKALDQPAHTRSLIRAFASRLSII